MSGVNVRQKEVSLAAKRSLLSLLSYKKKATEATFCRLFMFVQVLRNE